MWERDRRLMMTILEFIMEMDICEATVEYNRPYKFWSVDDMGNVLYMNVRDVANYFTDIPFGLETEREIMNHFFHDLDIYFEDEPTCFIPYEVLKPLTQIHLELEETVPFEFVTRQPLLCVRGICDRQCGEKEGYAPYCYRGLPCTNRRPDWNGLTPKYPNFLDLLDDTYGWMMICPHMDALVSMFEFTPTDYEPFLMFRYGYGLLIKNNTIRVVKGKEFERLYREYNEKYPTEDREIEKSINWGSEKSSGGYF